MNNITTRKPLSREIITELQRLTDAVQAATDLSSELLRTAQDRFGHELEEIEREGKKSVVTRLTLWQEVYYLGYKCEAADILMKYHPEVFEAYKAQDKLAEDMKVYCIRELGVDFTKMRIADYLYLTEQMFKMMMEEAKNNA